jgi:hypothetical protein
MLGRTRSFASFVTILQFTPVNQQLLCCVIRLCVSPRVDQVDYSAPSWVRGAAAGTCVGGGLAIAALLGWGLGDPTWSISSGIGALFAAAVFEVGVAVLHGDRWRESVCVCGGGGGCFEYIQSVHVPTLQYLSASCAGSF